MDSDLIDKVDFVGASTIKIALDRVEREFMKTHPLLNRRVAFLTMKQPEGQQMSEFLVTFKQSGKEADVDTMTIEELKATLIIGSCSNKELRTKLLEMKPATANKPTVPELAQLVVSVLKGLEFYLVQWFSGKVVLCCDATFISDGILSLSFCIFCERGN